MKRSYDESWYQSFEPGAREVVRAFHDVGVDTQMSCEGHARKCGNGGLFPHHLYIEFPPGTYKKNAKAFQSLVRGREGSYRWAYFGYGEHPREFYVYQTYKWDAKTKKEVSLVHARYIRKAWRNK